MKKISYKQLEVKVKELEKESIDRKQLYAELIQKQDLLKKQNINLVKKSIELSDIKRELEDKNYEFQIAQKRIKEENINLVRKSIELSDMMRKFEDFNYDLELSQSKLKTTLNSLRESEERFRDLADLLPQFVFEIGLDGKFQYANKFGLDTFGYTQEDLNSGFYALDIFVPEDRERVLESMNKVFSGEEFIGHEFQGLKKDGTTNYLLIFASPLFSNDMPVGIRGVAMDISELKKTEKELIRAKEKAEESDKLKSAFLANLSHEIRTPMNVILGFSTLLSQPEISTQERDFYINLIQNSSKDLSNLIDDIIDISKIEVGQVKIMKKPFEVNNMLDEVYYSFTEIIKNNNEKEDLKLILEKPFLKPNPVVDSDGNRIKQIFKNLLNNAIKFTNSGQIKIGYEVKQINDTSDSVLQFFVSDTGIGIPKHKIDIIFERFRQVAESTEKLYGGTGLGLTISKKLIELLGGRIWVESKYGQGSTFYFTIPFLYENFNTITKPKVINQTLSGNYDWRDKTILIIEDKESSFLFLKIVLQRTNANVIWLKNGNGAAEMCMDKSIDLVLMDIQLPGLNGYEITRQIKKENNTLPVIAQTAYALSGEREKCFEAGCDDYITKPIETQSLLQVISKYI